MELISSKGNNLKFYQRIIFWIVFFLLLGTVTSLVIYFGIDKYSLSVFLKHSFLDTTWYILKTTSLQSIGIISIFSEYFFWIIPDAVYYILEIIVWLIVWMLIIFLRKKSVFKVIAIMIVSWFLINSLGFIYAIWWNENWHNRVDFGA